jgi:hypothetical protein
VKGSSKYRLLARRTGTAGIVILASWCVAVPSYFSQPENPISWHVVRLAECLIVILPIPAIVIGLWSFRGLMRQDDRRDIGHAVFGIMAGLLSIVAALLILSK